MRQLTTLQDEAAARRLAAWLVVQKIDVRLDAEKNGWAIWVMDEDRLAVAKQHLAAFQADPGHPQFRNVEQQAAALEREEQKKRERAQKNTIEMSRRWGNTVIPPRSQPLVLAMVAISVLVFVLTDWGQQRGPGLLATLQFCGGAGGVKDHVEIEGLVAEVHRGPALTPVWSNIRAGEVWRLVTPMFIHFGWPHIIFNLMAVWSLGGQIENRLKTGWFLLMVIAIACVSNVAQVVVDTWWMKTELYPFVGNFGGMSGVNYGLFGFIFVRTALFQDRNYVLSPGTSLIMFIWLVLCIASNFGGPNFGGVANSAHVVGLLAGMAIGYGQGMVSGKAP